MVIGRKQIIVAFILVLVLVSSFILYQSSFIGKIFYPFPYKQTVDKYAASYGVDPYFVISVIREESRFRPGSNSHKGAVGLMQLMPNTAKEIAVWLGEDYAKVDMTNPEDNIRYGTWYLAALSKQFSGNTILTLAAYNAGSGRVTTWLNEASGDPDDYLIDDIPYKETREYVAKVLASYARYEEIYGGRK